MPNAPSPPGPFQWKTWFHGLIQPDTVSPQSVCGNSSQLSTEIHSPPPNRIPVWSGGQRNSFRKLHFPGALAVRQGHAVEFGPMSRDLLGISGKAFLSDLLYPSPFPSSCFECRHNAWKCSSHFVAMRLKKKKPHTNYGGEGSEAEFSMTSSSSCSSPTLLLCPYLLNRVSVRCSRTQSQLLCAACETSPLSPRGTQAGDPTLTCETDRQSRFDAWDRGLRAGALG